MAGFRYSITPRRRKDNAVAGYIWDGLLALLLLRQLGGALGNLQF